MDPNKKEDINGWCSKTEPFLGHNNENPVKDQNNEEIVQTSPEGKKLFQYIITLSGEFFINNKISFTFTSGINNFHKKK